MAACWSRQGVFLHIPIQSLTSAPPPARNNSRNKAQAAQILNPTTRARRAGINLHQRLDNRQPRSTSTSPNSNKCPFHGRILSTNTLHPAPVSLSPPPQHPDAFDESSSQTALERILATSADKPANNDDSLPALPTNEGQPGSLGVSPRWTNIDLRGRTQDSGIVSDMTPRLPPFSSRLGASW